MPRPVEYDGLLKIGSFKPAASSPASLAQFLRTADDMLAATQSVMPESARFLLAYEGMFNVVMAVLEFHEVRPGDAGGHRATAIQRVAADLKLDASRQSVLARLHDVRNRVTYRQPLPPITKADAESMQAVLAEMLPAARTLTGAA
ncbi:hypothetical protein [Roseateles sp.]|uniref:hypothetical protein n=1 Tax=Roseateles sp. TaxID=1971397 RepID=UPI003263D5C0